MNLFIRSLIFSIVMLTAMIFQSFVCILMSPLPLRYRFMPVISFIRFVVWALKVICNVNYKIEGLEYIHTQNNGIILSKHQSTWETFLIPSLVYQPAIILKRELLWMPFFGWGLATIDPIAINRSDKLSAMDQIIKKGKKCLDAGRWIVMFPEGTRIPVGKVGKYRLGGARLAVATGYPVIPVAHNAGLFWPKRKFLKYPGTVHVVFGAPIETKNRRPDEVMQEAKNWIETTVKRIDGKRK